MPHDLRKMLPLAALIVAIAPATAAPPLSGPPAGRLPDDAVPQAYRIDLTVNPDNPRFSSHVEIDVETKAITSSLWINGRDLHVTSVAARVAGGTVPARYEQVDALGVARISFARPLPAGRATLVFDYDASFGDGAAGLYRAQVDGEWYAWSQFEFIDARAAYTRFDQPGYKTPFAITLTTPPGATAVSNAPEMRVAATPDGMVRHVFALTRPLPTYLTAFMVGPFATASATAAPDPERTAPLPVRVVATEPNRKTFSSRWPAPARSSAISRSISGHPSPMPSSTRSPRRACRVRGLIHAYMDTHRQEMEDAETTGAAPRPADAPDASTMARP